MEGSSARARASLTLHPSHVVIVLVPSIHSCIPNSLSLCSLALLKMYSYLQCHD